MRIAFFYFLTFTLIFFSYSCSNRSSYTSTKKRQKLSNPARISIRKEEFGWEIKELQSFNNHNWSLVLNNAYLLSQNGIPNYKALSLNNIQKFTDDNLEKLDFNNKYIAFSVLPASANYEQKRPLYIGSLSKQGSEFKIVKFHKFTVPFSQEITGLKFLSTNKILLTSFLEYAIVDIKEKPGGDFNISFSHYPFMLYNNEESLGIANTYNGNDDLIYGGMGVSLLDMNRNNYNLKELFYFNQGSNLNRLDENRIVKLALVDTSFGAFLTYYGLVYYSRNPATNKPEFIQKDFLNLENSDSISASNIVDIKVLDDSDFISLTNNGLILQQKIQKANVSAASWKVIKRIYVNNPIKLFVINKDSIIVLSPGDGYLVYKNPARNLFNIKENINSSLYFEISHLAQPSVSYGVGLGDIDGNNKDYIYIVDTYDKNKLFASIPNWTINNIPDNIAAQRGVEGRSLTEKPGKIAYDLDIGVAFGDLNEDGAEDIILTNLAYSNSLYLNNGKGYFKDVTKDYNFDVNMWRSEGAVLGDVNNDGYLDVFCTSFFKSNKLFLNDHGVSLNDNTEKYSLTSNGRSISAVFGDVNNDGYLDLYVGNWMKENKLYLNNGKGEFVDYTKESNAGGGGLKETNSVFFADMNNDGYLDLFVGNRYGGDKLYLNNGDGTFRDITSECRFNGDYTYGAVFGDFENDGWQDIAIAFLGGIKIFKNLGKDNKGMIHFKDITGSAIQPGYIAKGYNTGLAVADFGHKGFLDLVLNQNNGYTYFLLNKTRLNGANNYLSVKVEGDKSNHDAIGAKLKLYYKDSLIAYREVSGGFGYASASSKVQHFGLGSLKDSLTLVAYFPVSKITRTVSVKPNSFIKVTEQTGFAREYYLSKKTFLRFVYGNSFVALGIEIILLALYFAALILFTIGKLKLNRRISASGIYFNWKLFSLSLIVFYAVKIVSVESMSFYFGSLYFIFNSSNLFTDEILPLIISSIFVISVLLFKKNKESKVIAGFNVTENLLTLLKRFDHGEGMLIILHRLSLLIENLNLESDSQSKYGKEAEERINSALIEYKKAVLPEINRLYNLIFQFELKEEDNVKYSSYAVSILQSSSQISGSCEKLLTSSSLIAKIKAKEEAVLSIKEIREELAGLRKTVQSKFTIDAVEAVELAIKKFRELYPQIEIIFSSSYEKINAIISGTDFNESINIIIQNAIDELHDKKVENGSIIIEADCNNESVIIKIKDNGNGILPDNIGKIFTGGFTTKPDGHGIGLTIAKKCIEKYEGELYPSNPDNGGTQFIIKLKAI